MELREILIVLGAVALCLLAFYLVCQTKVRTYIYALLLDAEKTDEDGQSKMDYVVQNAYDYIPVGLKVFISYNGFKQICQKAYDKLRDLAKDGKFDGEK